MAADGADLLPAGKVGEIVIRGPNVTAGYLANPEANERAFTAGWFRTGDQGYADDDGYIFLTGRLKEIINRGGEKISPREVDEVLLEHPGVKQAVAFALPDPALGEEVAAAVVLQDPSVTINELRHFAAARLADFKVPRKIVLLEEIPRGPTGKLRRIGLAEILGLLPGDEGLIEEQISDLSPVESLVAEAWRKVLELETAGMDQRFLDSGGDSITAMRLINHLRDRLQIEINLVDFFDAATIREQAAIVRQKIEAAKPE